MEVQLRLGTHSVALARGRCLRCSLSLGGPGRRLALQVCALVQGWAWLLCGSKNDLEDDCKMLKTKFITQQEYLTSSS